MIKRTISKNLLLRLSAQADEAEIYGNTKVAAALTDTITRFAEENAIRGDDEKYEYRSDDLRKDVRILVWSAAMRVFDYYENLPDARRIDEVVDDLTDTLVAAFENLVDGTDKGKYEPATPGEHSDVMEEDSVTWDVKPAEGTGGREVTIVDEDVEPSGDKEEDEIVKEGE